MTPGGLPQKLLLPLYCSRANGFLKCQDGDLNPGHEDFQSSALPTELSRRVFSAYPTYQTYVTKCKQIAETGMTVAKDGVASQ